MTDESKNKFAILYTCHDKEAQLNLSVKFFNRSDYLVSNFDVIVTSNSSHDKEGIKNVTSQFKCKKSEVYFDDENAAGYMLGVIEQVDNVYEHLLGYDLVLHLHPDVYVVSDHGIKNIFSDPKEKKDFYVWPMHSTYGLYNPAGKRENEYASDAWVFRPKKENNIFKNWRTYRDNPNLRSVSALAGPGREAYAEHYLYDNINKLDCEIEIFDRSPHAGQSESYEKNSGLWQSESTSYEAFTI